MIHSLIFLLTALLVSLLSYKAQQELKHLQKKNSAILEELKRQVAYEAERDLKPQVDQKIFTLESQMQLKFMCAKLKLTAIHFSFEEIISKL